MDYKDLQKILDNIKPSNKKIKKLSKLKWDNIAKPLDGLGELENIISKIAGIQENIDIDISKKAILIMCSDNGVVEEGISQAGMEVTKIVSENFCKGIASINILSKYTNTQVIAVDVGIKGDTFGPINKKIANGTKNFYLEAAMSKAQALEAIFVGIEMVKACKDKGFKILGCGEMGIGNTTTSATLASIFLKKDVEKVTGKGAGLSESLYLKKIDIIKRSILKRNIDKMDIFDILSSFGGFDIVSLVGLFIGAAFYKMPIIMDGLITNIAAFIAIKLNENCRDYIIASHKGKEPACKYLLSKMKLKAVLDANFCLGEGMGSAYIFSLIEMSLGVYNSRSSFESINVEKYKR